MNKFLNALPGCKTYIVAVLMGIAVFGVWQKWWVIPNDVYAGAVALLAVFIRAGITREITALSSAPTLTLNPPVMGGGQDARPTVNTSPQARPSTLWPDGPKGTNGTSGLVALVCGIGLLGMMGCVTSRVTTVTPGGTNAQGQAFSPLTNVVTVVNTNNLALDCAGVQVLTAVGVSAAILADTNAVAQLKDAATALGD